MIPIAAINVLLFFHICGFILWIGCSLALTLFAFNLTHENKEGLKNHSSLGELMDKIIFIPASLLTIVTGILMVIFLDFSFSELWIILSLIGVALELIIGGGLISKTIAKNEKLLKEKNPNEKLLKFNMRKLKILGIISSIVLFLVVLDMVFKPI